MAYNPYYSGGWQMGEEGDTPIIPAALNNMEDGIAGAVEKTGDDMTGTLTLPHLNVQSGERYSSINFRDINNVPRGMMWVDGESGRIFFRSINPDVSAADVGTIYTDYSLPASDLTAGSATYKIAVQRTKSVTETTDSNGNISLGLAAASYHVLSAKSSSRIVTPWVSGDDGNWHAHVTAVNGNATASTSVTVTVIYTLA